MCPDLPTTGRDLQNSLRPERGEIIWENCILVTEICEYNKNLLASKRKPHTLARRKTIYQQFSIAPRKEDETKPLRITQANVCKNIQSTALTNNPQMHFLVKYFPSYHREMPGLKGSSKT